ncbi:hypothetical protein ACSYAD_05790 [Acaryochloris marina NIES-2412]|uniref:hypothetical protein n=1 Tax=Acaryochloris marina TaxID=155978 RepID=UPI004057D3F8
MGYFTKTLKDNSMCFSGIDESSLYNKLVEMYLNIPNNIRVYLNKWIKPLSSLKEATVLGKYLYLDADQVENLNSQLINFEIRNKQIAFNFSNFLRQEECHFSNKDLRDNILRGKLIIKRLDLLSALYVLSQRIQERYLSSYHLWWLFEFSTEVNSLILPAVYDIQGKYNFFKNWTNFQRKFESAIQGDIEITDIYKKVAFDTRFNTYKEVNFHIDFISTEILEISKRYPVFDRSKVKPYLSLIKQERNRQRENKNSAIPSQSFILEQLKRGRPRILT